MNNQDVRAALRKELMRLYPAQEDHRNLQIDVARLMQDVKRHGAWNGEDVYAAIQEAIVDGILLMAGKQAMANPAGAVGSFGLPYLTVSSFGRRYLESSQSEPDPYDADSLLRPLRERGFGNETVGAYVPEAVRCFRAGAYKGTSVMLGVAAEAICEDLYAALGDHLGADARDKFKSALDAKKNSAEARWQAFVARFPADHVACLGDELNRRFSNVFEPHMKMFKQTRDDAAHRRATLIGKDGALGLLFSFAPFGITAMDVLKVLHAPCKTKPGPVK